MKLHTHEEILGDSSVSSQRGLRESQPAANPPTQPAPRQIKWTWNVRLLVLSAMVVVVVGGSLAALHNWQSSRLSSGLLLRAEAAEAAGNYRQQAQWLISYLRLEPDDVGAFIKLGIAADQTVNTSDEWDQARRRLQGAIAVTGTDTAWTEQRVELRKRLIKRLLQAGTLFAPEVKRQVLLLDAPPRDAQALNWLAKAALAMEEEAPAPTAEPSEQLNPGEGDGFWTWIAAQPTEVVLLEALKASPDDMELAIACLDRASSNAISMEQLEANPSLLELQNLAAEILERFKSMELNGRAQLAAYIYLSQEAGQQAAAQEFLETAVDRALDRLVQAAEQQPAGDTGESAESVEIELTNADSEYAGVWDWQLGLLAASRAVADNQDSRARKIYDRMLIASAVPISAAATRTVLPCRRPVLLGPQ